MGTYLLSSKRIKSRRVITSGFFVDNSRTKANYGLRPKISEDNAKVQMWVSYSLILTIWENLYVQCLESVFFGQAGRGVEIYTCPIRRFHEKIINIFFIATFTRVRIRFFFNIF